jgi:hypothetical protein
MEKRGGEREKFCKIYLANTPDVLGAVLVGEAEVLVEAEAHVVAVEPVRGEAKVQQVLL